MDTINDTIIKNSDEETTPRTRISLRDAVRLCGMSEKTLRRKLEAGLLSGNRETLDYGGFMWMIETRSLAELYPDSASLRDYISSLEVELQKEPRKYAPPTNIEPEAPTTEEAPEPHGFLTYLMEENRNLKEDLKGKEEQLRELQDRAMNLERECGEQKGTASTQARVLEWFQKQPQTALPAPAANAAPAPPTVPPIRIALVSILSASVVILLTLVVTRLF